MIFEDAYELNDSLNGHNFERITALESEIFSHYFVFRKCAKYSVLVGRIDFPFIFEVFKTDN